jgi:hypothetical protein
MFPGEFIDWKLVNENKYNILGDTVAWITFLDLFNWNKFEEIEGVIRDKYSMLSKLRTHLKSCHLDLEKGYGWTMACKMKILMMVYKLSTLNTIDVFTCNIFKRNTMQNCMGFLALQAEEMYTPAEQAETIKFMLERAEINTTYLDQNMQIYRAIKEDSRLSLQKSRQQVTQGRPRLRDKLTFSRLQEDKHNDAFNMWETYAGFCYKHQFPPTLSENLKMKLYFMASQTTWNWKIHLPQIAQGLHVITQKVAAYAVSDPDIPTIVKVIQNMNMDGRAPFALLNNFRYKCFQGFPVSRTMSMTITQYFHLYVAVYQNKAIWKEVWKHFIDTISVQIIRDCEQFVATTPFDHENVLHVLAGNTQPYIYEQMQSPALSKSPQPPPQQNVQMEKEQICDVSDIKLQMNELQVNDDTSTTVYKCDVSDIKLQMNELQVNDDTSTTVYKCDVSDIKLQMNELQVNDNTSTTVYKCDVDDNYLKTLEELANT